MEFRTQTIARALALILALPAFAEELSYNVRFGKLLKDGAGVLKVSETGVSFRETSRKKRQKLFSHEWAYQDIQQLFVAAQSLKLLTYQDVVWRLGADREFRFLLSGVDDFKAVYDLLKNRLDQRFVAAFVEEKIEPLWTIPVKRLGRIRGSEGELLVARDRIVYKSERPGDSRTWRMEDLENISSSGPYELVLTTNERALLHYGSMKGYDFRLKRKLDPKRVDELWFRLQQGKGLKSLANYKN